MSNKPRLERRLKIWMAETFLELVEKMLCSFCEDGGIYTAAVVGHKSRQQAYDAVVAH
ncbi:hypothetical protein HFN65_34945 [Rhizobium laguerreae]|uniref:hypothetical protein n=1 Tax=Rhizobium laguerreae TaxID=1076926 RepID=UPI001980237E|nr:hypothetical protein [Rhizobium laguerreae]MBY3502831.1 hypothetical protein [Rhizobium laguerreae]MBY3576106.1 hypothetical protein [Rhizobium laguerreae]